MACSNPLCDSKPPDSPLFLCGGCLKVKYCSRKCQIEDRKTHKDQCWRQIELPDVAAAPNLLSKATAGENKKGHRAMYAMGVIKKDEVVIVDFPIVGSGPTLAYYLFSNKEHRDDLWPRVNGLSVGEAASHKFRDNHFQLRNQDETALPSLAMTTINHSPNPNCIIVWFVAEEILILAAIALCDIPENTELTINYGPNYKGPGAIADGAAPARHPPLLVVKNVEEVYEEVVRLIGRNLVKIEKALESQAPFATGKCNIARFPPSGQPIEVEFELGESEAVSAYVDKQMQTVHDLIEGKCQFQSGILNKSPKPASSRGAAEP